MSSDYEDNRSVGSHRSDMSRKRSARHGSASKVSSSRRTSRVKSGSSRTRSSSAASASSANGRTTRMLSSHQYSTTRSSSSTYSQPATPLDLLRQPLVLLDSNIAIEKFNEDKGDLRAQTRTPSVKMMNKRDPSKLNHATHGARVSSRNSDAGSDDFASTGAYQPRVPSRKATKMQGSRSRLSRKTPSTRQQYSDTHSKSSHHSEDTHSIDSHDDNYTEFTSKPSAKSSSKRATSKRPKMGKTSAQRSARRNDTYSANRYDEQPASDPVPGGGMTANDPFGPDAFPPDQNGEEYVEVDRAPCPVCGRKFAVDRLGKHQAACKKSNKARKKFDINKQRLDAETRKAARQAKGSGTHKKKSEMPANKMPKWKRDHLQFQQILQAGKPQKKKATPSYGGGSMPASQPTYEQEDLDDRVPCPHCGRKFNAEVAERHIPRCKNIINKPKTIRRGQGNAGGVSAYASRTAAAARNGGGSVFGSTTSRRAPSMARRTTRVRR